MTTVGDPRIKKDIIILTQTILNKIILHYIISTQYIGATYMNIHGNELTMDILKVTNPEG